MKKYFLTSLGIGILLAILIGLLPLVASHFIKLGNDVSRANANLARKYYNIAHFFSYGQAQTDVLGYNEARLDYREKKYTESSKSFSGITEPSISFEAKHNLGNSLYRLGQTTQKPDETLGDWKNALTAYSGALTQRKDPETQANYDFVAKKIEEFEHQQKAQEEQKKQQNDNQSGSGSQSDSKSGSGSEQKGGDQKQNQNSGTGGTDSNTESGSNTPGTWTNKGNFNNVGSGGLEQGALTPAQEKELQQYLQGLKQSEKENRQFYQNQPTPMSQNGISDMIQNFFGNDPFFNNNLSGDRKKDW